MKNLHWAVQLLLLFAVITAAFYAGDWLLEKKYGNQTPATD